MAAIVPTNQQRRGDPAGLGPVGGAIPGGGTTKDILYYLFFPGGIADLTGTGSIFGQKPKLPYDPQLFQPGGPFIDPNANYQPGNPQGYAPIISQRNTEIANTLQMLGLSPNDWSFTKQQGMYNPPGQQSLMQTLAALQMMQGSLPPGSFGETQRERNITAGDTQQAGTAAQRNLILQEPQRLLQLLGLLTGESGLGAGTYATQQQLAAQELNQVVQGQQTQMGALSKIPILGNLFAGAF